MEQNKWMKPVNVLSNFKRYFPSSHASWIVLWNLKKEKALDIDSKEWPWLMGMLCLEKMQLKMAGFILVEEAPAKCPNEGKWGTLIGMTVANSSSSSSAGRQKLGCILTWKISSKEEKCWVPGMDYPV